VDFLHFDIEDGSFVPCMNLGTRLISELRPLTRLPFDVHLMMHNPEWLLSDLKHLGADRVTVHYEACPYPRRVLRLITDLGMVAGLAFNPTTPIPDLRYLLPYLSMILVLTTEPELPDAPYLPEVLDKLCAGKSAPGTSRLEWMVDGAVSPENVSQVQQAGADTIAVGRALFAEGQIARNLSALRAAA
jgi:ribulose-phosphate 3-epimerase